MDFWLPGGRSWRYTSWFSTHNPLGGAKWRWKIFAVMRKGIVGIFGILKEICSDFLFVGLHGWTFWCFIFNHHIVRGAEFSREENSLDISGYVFWVHWHHWGWHSRWWRSWVWGSLVAQWHSAMSPAIFQRKNRENQTGMFGTMLHSILKPSGFGNVTREKLKMTLDNYACWSRVLGVSGYMKKQSRPRNLTRSESCR